MKQLPEMIHIQASPVGEVRSAPQAAPAILLAKEELNAPTTDTGAKRPRAVATTEEPTPKRAKTTADVAPTEVTEAPVPAVSNPRLERWGFECTRQGTIIEALPTEFNLRAQKILERFSRMYNKAGQTEKDAQDARESIYQHALDCGLFSDLTPNQRKSTGMQWAERCYEALKTGNHAFFTDTQNNARAVGFLVSFFAQKNQQPVYIEDNQGNWSFYDKEGMIQMFASQFSWSDEAREPFQVDRKIEALEEVQFQAAQILHFNGTAFELWERKAAFSLPLAQLEVIDINVFDNTHRISAAKALEAFASEISQLGEDQGRQTLCIKMGERGLLGLLNVDEAALWIHNCYNAFATGSFHELMNPKSNRIGALLTVSCFAQLNGQALLIEDIDGQNSFFCNAKGKFSFFREQPSKITARVRLYELVSAPVESYELTQPETPRPSSRTSSDGLL